MPALRAWLASRLSELKIGVVDALITNSQFNARRKGVGDMRM